MSEENKPEVPVTMEEAFAQAKTDIEILLANIEHLMTNIDESLSEEDEAIVQQIRDKYTSPLAREAPPVDNDHVAEGCEKFTEAA